MKVRFSTLDLIAIIPELKSKICTGWRVNQVFDCDYKTYIFKLNKSIVQMKKDNDPLHVNEVTDNKMTFIIESGIRIHSTDYDWPKQPSPGQFASKLRKHLRNKRVEDIRQVGIDRIIDITFGSEQHANHLFIELFDRGNLILTDFNYVILATLRWRKPDNSQVESKVDQENPEDTEGFKVGQIYPLDKCRKFKNLEQMTETRISELLRSTIDDAHIGPYSRRNKQKKTSSDGFRLVNLKNLFNPIVIYGSSLLEDKLMKHLNVGSKKHSSSTIKLEIGDDGKYVEENISEYTTIIAAALNEAELVLKEIQERDISPGYIVQKKQTDKSQLLWNGSIKDKSGKKELSTEINVTTNVDFFPILTCAQRKVENENFVIQEFESFDKAVDIYYTNMEAQKLDSRAFNAEKDARKKLDKLKIAHEKKLSDLSRSQKEEELKARLIENNIEKVENALLIIRHLIANQMSWSDISMTIKEAQSMDDPIACLIKSVNFDRNEFSMYLEEPNCEAEDQNKVQKAMPNNGRIVEIDIGCSAYANARKFFGKRRTAVDKERKTMEVSEKVFKKVERKTKENLKQVIVKTGITKARKRYWFENFFWFISSEGYLIVAGRNAEQNDLLVKRYMKNNDIYVHGDMHGAATVIIKNESSSPVPPKTLTEAGNFAVCYSSAWDAKIVAASWWVYPNQVSKTAPTGTYLGTGSFIIRGKKNYLPVSGLILGFGLLFRLDDESVQSRVTARKAKESQLSTDGATENVREATIHDQDEHSANRENEPEDQNGEVLDDDEFEDNPTDHRLVDTLTESPEVDDILLYAIPVCGPYGAFQSYKYKVKVIPGANKRGKAAKTSLGLFLHDKRATQREKDLMNALKDQDYARNVPNKVKISAPNMTTMVKKKPKKSEVRLPIH